MAAKISVAYGINGEIMAAISMAKGEKAWLLRMMHSRTYAPTRWRYPRGKQTFAGGRRYG
jgi:hypothetical protein